MKTRLIVLGEKMPRWVVEATADYQSRLPRDWPLDIVELKPEKRLRGKTAAQCLAQEAPRIQAAIPSGAWIMALDERGEAWTTAQLAQKMQAWQGRVQHLVFLIGSADGLAPEIKQQAHGLLQLSAMTLPHGLARVLLVEQFYRAVSLLQGHPYHRE